MAEAKNQNVNIVRGTYEKYLSKKDIYDTNGSIYWCTDRSAVFANGRGLDLTEIQRLIISNKDFIRADFYDNGMHKDIRTYGESTDKSSRDEGCYIVLWNGFHAGLEDGNLYNIPNQILLYNEDEGTYYSHFADETDYKLPSKGYYENVVYAVFDEGKSLYYKFDSEGNVNVYNDIKPSNADWDAEEDEPGYILHKPFYDYVGEETVFTASNIAVNTTQGDAQNNIKKGIIPSIKDNTLIVGETYKVIITNSSNSEERFQFDCICKESDDHFPVLTDDEEFDEDDIYLNSSYNVAIVEENNTIDIEFVVIIRNNLGFESDGRFDIEIIRTNIPLVKQLDSKYVPIEPISLDYIDSIFKKD